MRLAKRVEELPPYLFAQISKVIAAKKAQGIDVITFGIGDPDLPTPPHILDRLHRAADNPLNHRYPESEGLPELRQAISGWYERRFEASFDPERECLALIGSKEGIAHMALTLIDPGDVALATDPGYPVYEIGTMFAGGVTIKLPLTRESEWKPDLDAIPEDLAAKAKVLWLNYPNNPTAAVADIAFFEKVVAWAKEYDVSICHDNPYCDVAYDGYRPISIFQVPGARDVAIEFNSWSKIYNMTGWRIGMAVGNGDLVDALMRVKSNIDSGIPQAIQEMAIEAVEGPQDVIDEHNAIYQRRRDRIVEAVRKIGLEVDPPKASLYVWAKLPEGITSGDFAARLIDECAVVVTPGRGYGLNGEGYVRLSVTTPDDQVEEGCQRLENWKGF
ncbi:MAG: aminotransferase class I/II-fold pyridoxal phosphate-dependent enzyme [Dehalococcoidia bacterium]|nr:LL-diaminopimelate aminotransferase [Chloroflexota bacterium]MXW25457.1 aminotransferase class I/II-fold pyridoxal phosphate-dependent enzyme [Dehalococcoidia bacterium]MXZ88096.1 aminotransferase class I/II-fold pyridoxal phosphate-dependent enzyme [Dehalococcoidia bacterium]MYA52856.1 aminotransferase class I/II-fold pyridoxal phosphate-dependent enzyme [Dehalococcoidia bacterium]MYH67368.1 aminotransferase class I/II-fold pyridoxal phosphate-dependent enzyme [Dehalococcoidia bacterium]